MSIMNVWLLNNIPQTFYSGMLIKAGSEMEPRAAWTVIVFHDAVATVIDAFNWNLADGLCNPSENVLFFCHGNLIGEVIVKY